MSNLPSGTEMLAGVMVVPLILGLVEASKQTFLKEHTEWAVWLAIALGLLISVGWAVAGGTTAPAQYAQSILIGLGYGLAAGGLYNVPPVKSSIMAYKASRADKADGPLLDDRGYPYDPHQRL